MSEANCSESGAGEAGANLGDLSAFVVTADYAEGSELVFAEKPSRAKMLAHGTSALCDFEWTDLRCRREPVADKYGKDFTKETTIGYDKNAQKILRELGWHQLEGEQSSCRVCDLYEWDEVPESALIWEDKGEPICKECAER